MSIKILIGDALLRSEEYLKKKQETRWKKALSEMGNLPSPSIINLYNFRTVMMIVTFSLPPEPPMKILM